MKNILILLSSILLLSSCGMIWSNSDVSNTQTQSATTVSYTADLDATSNKIKDSEEFQGCMKQNTNMCIQSAGMQLAQKAKDPAFCKELLTPDQQSSCEFAVTMMNATEQNDEKICDTITDVNYQQQCKIQIYKQQAISKKDITLCNKVDELTKPTGTGIALDVGMQKDQCVMQYIMSVTGSDEKDCESLSNTGSLEMCKTMITNRSNTPDMPQWAPIILDQSQQTAPTSVN